MSICVCMYACVCVCVCVCVCMCVCVCVVCMFSGLILNEIGVNDYIDDVADDSAVDDVVVEMRALLLVSCEFSISLFSSNSSTR